MRYYLDTSIWLDLFENRNEPGFSKGKFAKELIGYILENEQEIVFSDNNLYELAALGYAAIDVEKRILPLRGMTIVVHADMKSINHAVALARERDIPRRDALHALLAKRKGAVLITYDKHFSALKDLVKVKRPSDFV